MVCLGFHWICYRVYYWFDLVLRGFVYGFGLSWFCLLVWLGCFILLSMRLLGFHRFDHGSGLFSWVCPWAWLLFSLNNEGGRKKTRGAH